MLPWCFSISGILCNHLGPCSLQASTLRQYHWMGDDSSEVQQKRGISTLKQVYSISVSGWYEWLWFLSNLHCCAGSSLNTPFNPFLLWLPSSAFGAFPWAKRVINGFPAARAKIFFGICSAACFPALCVKLLSTQQTLSRSDPAALYFFPWYILIHCMQHR